MHTDPRPAAIAGGEATDSPDGTPVTSIRVLYPDLHGVARGKDVPIAEFDHDLEEGLRFCAAVMGTDLRHTSVVGGEVGARIAYRTVADEYFKVSETVEAIYDQPKELPAEAEGADARPVDLDCHFESCTFFQTSLEFRPTPEGRRDDAANKGQVGRQKIFDGLLERLDQQAS